VGIQIAEIWKQLSWLETQVHATPPPPVRCGIYICVKCVSYREGWLHTHTHTHCVSHTEKCLFMAQRQVEGGAASAKISFLMGEQLTVSERASERSCD
jgi:hypothetical protein